MIEKVEAACEAFLTESAFNDFWVASALPDNSFEEGSRSVEFRRVLETYERAGVDPDLLRAACRGINGNLQLVLERPEFGLGSVHRNTGEGQDLEFGGAAAEVKLLHDCTQQKHYGTTAADWDKLSAVRRDGFSGPLFLIVFFVEFPHRVYAPRRPTRRVIHVGIDSQYRALRRKLIVEPTWPRGGPGRHALQLPSEPVAKALERRCDNLSGTPLWHQLSEQMRDAAVAACVWEYPVD